MPFRTSMKPYEGARALAQEHLAVLPTETVYGLGALATSATAVGRVFTTKNRPADHPLIAHVLNDEAAIAWARNVPSFARSLMNEFWPGPMTVSRSSRAADFITGGQDSVAIRVPFTHHA